jgi:hypothetical protein
MTFACRDAALGKCVREGYKPWQGDAARALHQACTRAVRADYCGAGHPFTVEGRPLLLVDGDDVVDGSVTGDKAFEAVWGPDHATCISRTRLDQVLNPDLPDFNCGDLFHIPICNDPDLASPSPSGGLLREWSAPYANTTPFDPI